MEKIPVCIELKESEVEAIVYLFGKVDEFLEDANYDGFMYKSWKEIQGFEQGKAAVLNNLKTKVQKEKLAIIEADKAKEDEAKKQAIIEQYKKEQKPVKKKKAKKVSKKSMATVPGKDIMTMKGIK